MTRTYLLVIEGDDAGYSAYVPELPTILITGRTIEELTNRATEAIRLYWECATPEDLSSTQVRQIEVELSTPA